MHHIQAAEFDGHMKWCCKFIVDLIRGGTSLQQQLCDIRVSSFDYFQQKSLAARTCHGGTICMCLQQQSQGFGMATSSYLTDWHPSTPVVISSCGQQAANNICVPFPCGNAEWRCATGFDAIFLSLGLQQQTESIDAAEFSGSENRRILRDLLLLQWHLDPGTSGAPPLSQCRPYRLLEQAPLQV